MQDKKIRQAMNKVVRYSERIDELTDTIESLTARRDKLDAALVDLCTFLTEPFRRLGVEEIVRHKGYAFWLNQEGLLCYDYLKSINSVPSSNAAAEKMMAASTQKFWNMYFTLSPEDCPGFVAAVEKAMAEQQAKQAEAENDIEIPHSPTWCDCDKCIEDMKAAQQACDCDDCLGKTIGKKVKDGRVAEPEDFNAENN